MEAKLTAARRHALAQIADMPGKSGVFWRPFGISPQTLMAAERDGQLEGRGGLFPDDGSRRRSWFITEAGRRALPEEPR